MGRRETRGGWCSPALARWLHLSCALAVGCGPGSSSPGDGPVDGGAAADVMPRARPDAGPPGGWRVITQDDPHGLVLSVWARSAGDVYFAGGQVDAAAIGRWQGAEITWMENPGAARAWWIFGLTDSAGEPAIYVVGERGLGLRRSGEGAWVEWPTGVAGATLYGVWGTAEDDLWIAGGDIPAGGPIVLRHWDGRVWTDADLPELGPEAPPTLFKVWGTAPDRVFAVGDRGLMLRYDGAAWTRVPAPEIDAVLTVHGSGPADVWAVGGRAQGGVLRLGAKGWVRDPTAPELLPALAGVSVVPGGEVLVSGANGLIMERTREGEWQAAPALTRDFLHAVTVTEGGGRWAVGGNLLEPVGPHRGVILRGDRPLGPPGTPPAEICGPGWVRGRGTHRLYLQGRQGFPDERGRYPLSEDRSFIVHGEHYLIGQGAFAEWTTTLCGSLGGEIFFFIPNNDSEGSRAKHELFRVRDGEEVLLADAVDTQAGQMGYIPFEARRDMPAGIDTRPGDELLLRSTNLNDVMFSVMIWRPPSDYMSYLDLDIVTDGPPLGDPNPPAPEQIPCSPGLVIGTDGPPYRALGPQAPLDLVIGPQGSYMILFGLRAPGIVPGDPADALAAGNPLVELRATMRDRDGGDREIGNLLRRVGFQPEDGGSFYASNLNLTINPDLQPDQLLDNRVQIAASVTDAAGLKVCGEQTIVPVAPP